MKNIIYLKQCHSTNDEILNFLFEKEIKFLSVYTFHQTNGRGQYSKEWLSGKEQNLAFSFAFPAKNINLNSISLNFYTANLISDFITELTKNLVKIKWPNDLIINKKKICGVLIEEKKIDNENFYIIGIGLNVLQNDFSFLPKAGSILSETGKIFDLHKLANSLFHYLYIKFSQNIDLNLIFENYNQNLFRKDLVSVFKTKNIRQNGIIKFVDEKGFLWIEFDDGNLHKFFHKEIEMLY